MEENDRSPSPSRSSLPPPLHRHLKSAPQSSQSGSTIAAHTPILWPGVQRSTTDPEFYTYPPPLNTMREPGVPSLETQPAETTNCLPIGVYQNDVPHLDEHFPSQQRIGHAESYTRADDSIVVGGSHPSPRRAHSSVWRAVPVEQPEGHSRYSFSPHLARPQRGVAEPSSSRFSFIPYVAVPEGPSARSYARSDPNASSPSTQMHAQPYIQPAASHSLPELPSPDDYVNPVLDSVLLGLAGPSTTVDGSSSEAGQGDPVEEENPKKVGRKGKRRAVNPGADLPPLRRPKKKTEIACNFCRERKLGCSGERPKCEACIKREKECIYQATPRRRGPGKAPRGSRKLAKIRETGARSQRSTPEEVEAQPTIPNLSLDMPFPSLPAPGADSFGLPATNCEEGQDPQWQASSLDRAFLSTFSSPSPGLGLSRESTT